MRYRLYKPAKSASQSGRAKSGEWLLEPEVATARLPEPLMGWSSAADTGGELRGRLRFASKEEALAFVRRQGLDCMVDTTHERRIAPRSYLDNFRPTRAVDEERRLKKV